VAESGEIQGVEIKKLPSLEYITGARDARPKEEQRYVAFAPFATALQYLADETQKQSKKLEETELGLSLYFMGQHHALTLLADLMRRQAGSRTVLPSSYIQEIIQVWKANIEMVVNVAQSAFERGKNNNDRQEPELEVKNVADAEKS
jgi:hypothetical protein